MGNCEPPSPNVEKPTDPSPSPAREQHAPSTLDTLAPDTSIAEASTARVSEESSRGPVDWETARSRWDEQYENAHTLSPTDISRVLGVSLQHGLTNAEASSRLRLDGPNKVAAVEGVSYWKILLRQVSNSLTLVLVMTMALSFGINDIIEGVVITVVILLNVVVGFVQDYRAEQTILSLRALSAPTCKVLRDGRIEFVKAETLVIGDVVQLAVGDMVPADLRLFEGMNASADEALLTGESIPVVKTPYTTCTMRDMPIGDRTNMMYAASTVTQGRSMGIVIAVAMRTEVGKIAGLLRDESPGAHSSNAAVRIWGRFRKGVKNVLGLVGTPLQVKLSKFALLLFALAILLAIIVFSANKWNVEGEVLIYGICVAVAVIPESLIAVLTITVALGTKAMARGNVIVRKLQALEAVGGVTNICSDKTGTLTQGKMIARRVWIPRTGAITIRGTTSPYDPTSGSVDLKEWDATSASITEDGLMTRLLHAIALCNLASVYNNSDKSSRDTSTSCGATEPWTAVGEPTDVALQVLAMRFQSGKPALLQDGNRQLLAEYPFDSALKKMTVIYKDRKKGVTEAFTKGAAEVILPAVMNSEQEKEEIRSMVDRLADQGLRVLCIAHKLISDDETAQLEDRQLAEAGLQFVGLVGLYDPPRVETADAVRRCQLAGIKVHMLTGDHIKTATAIAHEVGILGTAASNMPSRNAIMPAHEFDQLSDTEIDRIDSLPLVLARCSPTTKVRMVEAMHRRKAFCVMTGDGVNDSPALRRADVGIAMGLNGSDVAKEAADMVLTDDDFASIVKAVEEGRRLFDNIQKFLLHLLVSNIAQVVLLLIALAFKDEGSNSVFPLSPLEILWVNLITSSFLALGLGLEEAQPDIMSRAPHDLRVGVFTRELIVDKMIYGTFMGSLCLVAFVSVVYGAGGGDLGEDCNQDFNPSCDVVFRARATTYATLSFLLLVTAWEVKHFSRSLFNLDPSRHSGPFSVFATLWRNRFLFWAVAAGFVTTFVVVYLPTLNRLVFKHTAISWEWGIVFGCVVVYAALVESWKAVKRAYGIGGGKDRARVMSDTEVGAETVLEHASRGASQMEEKKT